MSDDCHIGIGVFSRYPIDSSRKPVMCLVRSLTAEDQSFWLRKKARY